MTPKQAKDKAFEGGWTPLKSKTMLPGWQVIALDPTFWQALGLALNPDITTTETKALAHRFYDLILPGQSTESFWADLLQ